MATLIFDDLGNSWPASVQKFRATFAIPTTEPVPSKYAVKVLGFVAIDCFGRSAQFRLVPSIVHMNAIAAALAWVRRQVCDRIVIDYFDCGWKLSVVRNCDAAEAMIEGLLEVSQRKAMQPRIVRQNPTDQLKPVATFSKLLAEWRAAMAGQIPFEPANLAQRYLGDRYVVDEQRPDGEIIYKEIGPGFHYFGANWMQNSRGKPISEQPDRDYGRWIAGHYREALESNTPRIDDIDALVHNADGSRMRFRIKRVIVPIIIGNGPPLLIGGSIYDDKVDLRQASSTSQSQTPLTSPLSGKSGPGLSDHRRPETIPGQQGPHAAHHTPIQPLLQMSQGATSAFPEAVFRSAER
jgi:hypothetical protein